MKTARMLALFLFLTLPSLAQTAPREVVDGFYKAYQKALQNSPSNWVEALMTDQQSLVEAPLSEMLVRLAKGQPGTDEAWLDFDPISNSQMGIDSYSLGQASLKDSLAYVPVNLHYERDPGPAKMRVRVVLRQSGGEWKIANFAYPAGDGAAAWDLLSFLKDSLKATP